MSYLLDYADNKRNLDDALLEDVESILIATITVVTGDEILDVVRRNGEHDGASSYSAMAEFYDGEYDIIRDGVWVVDKDEWDKRSTSYEFLYGE